GSALARAGPRAPRVLDRGGPRHGYLAGHRRHRRLRSRGARLSRRRGAPPRRHRRPRRALRRRRHQPSARPSGPPARKCAYRRGPCGGAAVLRSRGCRGDRGQGGRRGGRRSSCRGAAGWPPREPGHASPVGLDALGAEAHARVQAGMEPLDVDEEDRVAQAVYDALFGPLGPVLGQLLEDPSVTDIHANGFDRVWIIRADGSKELGPAIAASDAEMTELIRNAAARAGLRERRFDAGSPQLDLRLPDGSRVSAVRELSARPVLSIRRHRYMQVSLEDLRAAGTLDVA